MAWEQLVGIIDEAGKIDADARNRRPVECPNDHTALVEAPNGVLHCPWDGWQHPRGA